ncbi:hypothetical protein ANCDUO_09912 [Ancylostoma duodenale]|uniref:Uncharacterized protein n=1 Tax=Ancylostoma duodenale TaxID=51022 RepID=A0A0C2GS77_9BILA|nr:hypothetical protein ANCDUO_09912 [Ancylostoma duodenale]
MIVIIGTCAGAVLILIVATILYRQKYMWMEKLNRFRTRHEDDGEDDDDAIIDYWELSPEKVVVKNEQLGHGAYGQPLQAEQGREKKGATKGNESCGLRLASI